MKSGQNRLFRLLTIQFLLAGSTFCLPAMAKDPLEANKTQKTIDSRTPERKLASEEDDTTNQRILSGFLAKPPEEVSNEVIGYLKRIVAMHLKAELYLQEFDAELDKALKSSGTETPVTQKDGDTYPKLVATWIINHRLKDRVSYIYQNLLRIRLKGTSQEKEMARKVISEMTKHFENLNPESRVHLQSLINTLVADRLAFIQLNRGTGTGPKSIDDESEFSKFQFKDSTKLQEFLKQNRKLLLDKIKQARTSQAVDDAAVEFVADQVKEAMSESGVRQPQALRIAPDVGRDGNITGRDFPAGTWALTYDDGPSARWTPQILDALKETKVPATFFWLAQNVQPSWANGIVARAKNEGHALANHSFSHANLPKISSEALKKEVIESTKVQQAVYGQPVEYFRCPYGACIKDLNIRQMIADQKMIHVFWNVDSLDWQDKNPESILARVTKQMQIEKKGIILFHDIHPQSFAASKALMNYFNQTKVRAVTVPQIVNELTGKK